MFQQLVISFLATAAFAIIFSVPRNLLVASGFVGMVGWGLYTGTTMLGLSSIPANLIAAFGVSMLSQLFARRYRAPVTVFAASGIVPLVPGGQAFDAMRYFVENNYNLAVQFAAKAFLLSGAIAMGLILSEVFYQLIRHQRGAF
ncbi:threonine/serine exporter family protein [Alicyclobacillus curvatus]|nr:threonine/serine exporter family protein [Alicyclobacillus curvatus]